MILQGDCTGRYCTDKQYISDIEARMTQTLDLFKTHDLLQSFDVFKTTRPDLTTYTEQWCAYVKYSHDLAHPKFVAPKRNKPRRPKYKPDQPDMFDEAGAIRATA